MFLAFERCAVPVLEDFDQTVKVILDEAIELDNAGIALLDSYLVALGGSAPLRRCDVGAVECEGIAAGRGLPTEAVFGKSALAALLGEIEVDAIEALAVVETVCG